VAKGGGVNWFKCWNVEKLKCCEVAANEGAETNNEKTKTIRKYNDFSLNPKP
jgi:hypothetical protein